MTMTDTERERALKHVLAADRMSKWERMIYNAALERAAQECHREDDAARIRALMDEQRSEVQP